MKKLLFIILLFGLVFSCSKDDPATNDFTIELLPIEQISFPNSFVFDGIYTIEYSYRKPSDCHLFHDLYYYIQDDDRTLAVLSKKINNDYCQTLEEEIVTKSFDFHCSKENGAYTFKIWQGEDNQGEAQFLIFEVPIIN